MTLDAIGAARVIPVLRTDSADDAIARARRALTTGFSVVELTATTPKWERALEVVRSEHPEAVIGLGTVLDAAVARRAAAVGASFLVSPVAVPEVRAAADELPVVEGGLTPNELHSALAHSGIAKLFPAHAVGPRYLCSLLAVFPGARIVPSGGIKLREVDGWLAAGAHAVCVGSDLTSGQGAHLQGDAEPSTPVSPPPRDAKR